MKHNSRRHFIKQLTAATVASSFASDALADSNIEPFNLTNWRTQRFDNVKKHHDILILGAGIAGLCISYELAQQGIDCQILEAREKPGGRNETIRHSSKIIESDRESICDFTHNKHLYFNVGPARISQQHERVLHYCKEFSIPLEPLINDNRNAYFSVNDAFDNVPSRMREIYTSQRGLISSLLAQAIDQNLVSHLFPSHHNDKMLNMLKSFGDLDEQYQFMDSNRSGVMPGSGTFTPKQALKSKDFTELLPQIDYWARKLHFEQSLDQHSTMLQPVGGMDRIVKKFVHRGRPKIRYNSEVLEIKRDHNGARVSYRDKHNNIRTMSATQVIVTLPLTVLQDIEHDFSNEITQEIDNANYSSAGKIAFQSERFWETDAHIFGGISWLGSDNTQIWYPSSNFGANSGILVGGYIFGGSAGERFAQLSNQERIDSALSQIAHVHPNTTENLQSPCSRSWKNTPFSKGGWSNNPPIKAFSHNDGPYIFAGDHTTYLSGWQEGAIASAHRALDLICFS